MTAYVLVWLCGLAVGALGVLVSRRALVRVSADGLRAAARVDAARVDATAADLRDDEETERAAADAAAAAVVVESGPPPLAWYTIDLDEEEGL